MRGVLSAGMTLALENLDTRLAFDRIYGSSAGSLMGAYFIAGQSALAPSIYVQDLPNRRFISRRRVIGRRPILDLDYLVDHVIENVKPLDWDAVLQAPIELHVLTTDITQSATLDLSGFESQSELKDAMRASARLPGLAGPPVTVKDAQCYDSGLTDSLAYRSALRGGATHVLALKTRPDGGAPQPLSRGQQWAMRRVLGVPADAIQLVSERPALYAKETAELSELVTGSDPDGRHVFAIGPKPDDPTIGRLGRSRSELELGARVGIEAVFRAVEHPVAHFYDVLRPYWHPPV